MLRILIAFAALLAPAVAHAEDWRVITVSDDWAAIFMLDADSLAPGESTVRRARILAVTGENGDGFAALSATLDFDCTRGRKRIVTVTAHDADGTALSTDGMQPWGDMAPSSNYANIAEVVCGRHELPEDSLGAGLPISAAREMLADEQRRQTHQQ